MRTLEDHFYRFESGAASEASGAPQTESAFEAVLEDLVDEGLVAKEPAELPRYSTSFSDVLDEIGPNFTASDVDRLCEQSGMGKRVVYATVLADSYLDLDVTR